MLIVRTPSFCFATFTKTAAIGSVALLMIMGGCHRHAATPTPVSGTSAPGAEGASAVFVATRIDEGRYLTTAGNCISCHTRPGGQPFAGGVPFETPLGTIYSSNITQDPETGIGRWTESDLAWAMREGISADGHRLYPAFPYTSFTKVTDEDIAAIYAYLRTVGRVRYTPPDNGLAFRFRPGVAVWNALSFRPGRYVPDPNQSADWNRGAYLVEGLGHCGACHTPRNWLLAEGSRRYAGGELQGPVPGNKIRRWSGANLTPSATGLGHWSVPEIAKYLKTGYSQRGGTFGPMNDVIVNSTRYISVDDIRAIAAYLTSLSPQEPIVDRKPTTEQIEAGGAIYAERCEKCHLSSGRGGLFNGPRLAGSAVVQAADPASLINIILYGPDVPTAALGAFGSWEVMKPYKEILSDDELATVSNYVRNSWGNKGNLVTAHDVAQQR